MRFFPGILLFIFAGALCAQVAEEPEVVAAKAELEKTRAMVDIGALPRVKLEKAQEAVADAEDTAILRKTAYGQELTVDQSDEMLAAAARRLDRRQKALDEAQKLVDAGVATPKSLTDAQQDLSRAKLESNLAQSRADVTRQLAAMAEAEVALETKPLDGPVSEHSEGSGRFEYATFARVETAYEHQFGKKMPVSAMGETAVHRSLGFDHRGRVDVAIHPDEPEGVWLLDYLKDHHIPYYAFRHAVPGKATGAHIHIGPGSTRLVAGG